MTKKVVIDCDPGIDDALALILAFHSPELEVVGISGVNGNVSLDKVMRNIEKILTLIRPETRPLVARGAERPLKGESFFAEHVHGEDGLGEWKTRSKTGEVWWRPFPGTAAEFLIQCASRSPGEITVIAVGPLTNVALALQESPERMKQIKEIVVMGGALGEKGNITPFAEFNFFVDPLAARTVLDSGIPATLVTLDATHGAPLTPQDMQIFEDKPGRFAEFLIESTGYDFMKRRFRRGRGAFYLHDPLAVAEVIIPDLFQKSRLPVFVETGEGDRYGQMREGEEGQTSPDQKADVCLSVDAGRFLQLFLSRLESQTGAE